MLHIETPDCKLDARLIGIVSTNFIFGEYTSEIVFLNYLYRIELKLHTCTSAELDCLVNADSLLF